MHKKYQGEGVLGTEYCRIKRGLAATCTWTLGILPAASAKLPYPQLESSPACYKVIVERLFIRGVGGQRIHTGLKVSENVRLYITGPQNDNGFPQLAPHMSFWRVLGLWQVALWKRGLQASAKSMGYWDQKSACVGGFSCYANRAVVSDPISLLRSSHTCISATGFKRNRMYRNKISRIQTLKKYVPNASQLAVFGS